MDTRMEIRAASTSSTTSRSEETPASSVCTGAVQQPPKGPFMRQDAFISMSSQPCSDKSFVTNSTVLISWVVLSVPGRQKIFLWGLNRISHLTLEKNKGFLSILNILAKKKNDRKVILCRKYVFLFIP